MNEVYTRRRDLVCDALAQAGVNVTPPKATIYIWAPVPAGLRHRRRVLRARARAGGGGHLARRRLRPNGEGFFRISLTTPDDRLLEAVQRLSRL